MNRWQRSMDRPAWRWAPTAILTLACTLILRHFTHSDTVALAGANVWEVADWICMEGLDILTNKLAIASGFDTSRQAEFEKNYPVGDTVRVPLPVMGTIRTGLGYIGTPVVNKHTTVTADQVFGMDFDIDSVESALRTGASREFISEKVIKPYMVKMAQEWDMRAANFAAVNCPNITGNLGTDPTTFDGSSTAARQMIVELGGWDDDAMICLPPSVMRNLRTNTATAFNPITDISKAFRTGLYRSADGFDFYESMSLLNFSSGTWASPTGMTVRTTSVSGDTTLDITCTTGDVFKPGDIIQVTGSFRVNPITKQKIGARQLTLNVTSNTTAAASRATPSISIGPYGIIGPGDAYQNVDRLPVANDVITMFPAATLTANTAKTGNQGLAFNKRAFMLVGIPLEVPSSAEKAAQKRDDNTGIAIRFTKTWDAIQSRMVHRLDTCGGFGVGFSDSCAVRIQCA